MKRFFVLIIAAALALCFSGTAFADTLTGGTVESEISGKQACSIALKDAKLTKAKVKNIKAEGEKKGFEVKFKKKRGGTEFEYEIAKSDGKILEKEVRYSYKSCCSKAKIGKKAALKKVAKHSKKKYSVVKKGSCKYKYSNHEGRYKVKFKYKGYRYEYEVQAPTGKILEWERELIKR